MFTMFTLVVGTVPFASLPMVNGLGYEDILIAFGSVVRALWNDRNPNRLPIPDGLTLKAMTCFAAMVQDATSASNETRAKINCIKLLRSLFSMGLGDAKDMIEFFMTIQVKS